MNFKNEISRGKRFIKKRIYNGHAPDFIIAGAQKSGTTSLHYYLSKHPNILASYPKEVRYFDRDDNFAKGKKWYHRAFVNLDTTKKDFLCFEATPEYIYRSFAAKRMHHEYPELRIIMILREPVKRAYSSWNMYRDFPVKFKRLPGKLSSKNGYLQDRQNNLVRELYQSDHFPTFEEAVRSEMIKIETGSDIEEPSFIRRGIYLSQIKRFHNLFGKDQVLILGFKDLVQNKKDTLNQVLNFLGLEESTWDFIDEEKKNVRTYPQKISPGIEQELKNFYEPYNKELFNYLGTKINW